jgi:hypothetical protein
MGSSKANPHEYVVLECIKEIHTIEVQHDKNLEASHQVHEQMSQRFNTRSTHHNRQFSKRENCYPCQALVSHKIGCPRIWLQGNEDLPACRGATRPDPSDCCAIAGHQRAGVQGEQDL